MQASHYGGFSRSGALALGTWASVAAVRGLSSRGAQVQLLRSVWNLPGPVIEPVSIQFYWPALQGGFLSAVPPRETFYFFFFFLA